MKSCLFVSDHCLTSSKLFSASNMASFTRFANPRVPCLCHIFPRKPNVNPLSLQCVVFPPFLLRRLPFSIPSCNFLPQDTPCFIVKKFNLPVNVSVPQCKIVSRKSTSPGRVATFLVWKTRGRTKYFRNLTTFNAISIFRSALKNHEMRVKVLLKMRQVKKTSYNSHEMLKTFSTPLWALCPLCPLCSPCPLCRVLLCSMCPLCP